MLCVTVPFCRGTMKKASFVIGLVSGLFGGLVGLGGGMIMVPLMSRFLRMSQHRIHGTSLIAVVCAGISGAAAYARSGFIDWGAALILAVAASLTSRTGARMSLKVNEATLKRLFGSFLIVMAVLLVARPLLPSVMGFGPLSGPARDLMLVAIGLSTGFLSGLLGIGGGVFLVLGMVFLAGMDQVTAQGCSLVALLVAGSVGAWTHWDQGTVDRDSLPALIPAVIIGAYLGGDAAVSLQGTVLMTIFAVVLAGLGVDLWLRARRRHDPSASLDGGGLVR